MRGRLLCLVILGALASPLPPALAPAPVAAAQSTATCVHRWTDDVTPGVGPTMQRATFSSHGETGAIECQGEIMGRRVTGPGTFGEEGVVEGTCGSGTGSATFSFTVVTSGGPLHLRMPVSFTYGPLTGVTTSESFPGVFVVVPMMGDCLTAPVTRIAVTRAGMLRT